LPPYAGRSVFCGLGVVVDFAGVLVFCEVLEADAPFVGAALRSVVAVLVGAALERAVAALLLTVGLFDAPVERWFCRAFVAPCPRACAVAACVWPGALGFPRATPLPGMLAPRGATWPSRAPP
jgi:hypothetical protein